MKTRPATLAALALCLFAGQLRADEKPLREILRDGLYAEEVSRDPAAAAESYEAVLARYAEQRDFAAAALFRLAEVRRKQDRKDDAIKLYQRLLAEFPQAENEAKLARVNLAALGGKVPEAETPGGDPESKELARLQTLAKTSPDLLRDPATLDSAVRSGFPKAVAFLLSAGADPFGGAALRIAAGSGNLAMVKQLLTTGKKVPEAVGQAAVNEAVKSDRGTVLTFLLESGIRPDSRTLYDVLLGANYAKAEVLLKHGADPNAILPALNGSLPQLLLNALIYQKRLEAAAWLLDHGAKPDIADDTSNATPLYYAAISRGPGCVELMERLLKAGANPNRLSVLPGAGQRTRVEQSTPPPGETALDSAIASGYQTTEKCKVLLAHGADPNLGGKEWPLQFVVRLGNFEVAKLLIDAGADLKKPGLLTPFLNADDKSNVEKLHFLLENGADPNIPVGMQKIDRTEFFDDPFLPATGKVEEYSMLPLDGIKISMHTPDIVSEPATVMELIRVMLDAGAKMGPMLGQILEVVAKNEEKGEIFGRLLAQRPTEIDIRGFSDLEKWKPAARRIYLKEVMIPELAKLPEITLLERETGKRTTLAEGGDGKALPSTLDLLREQKGLMLGKKNRTYRWPELTLARRGEDKTIPFDLNGDAALPELRAGDVLEVTWGAPYNIGNDEGRLKTSGRYEWSIEKRISFPITLEIDGKPREILLRGDLLSFDPTKAEAPRVDAASLIGLFLGDAAVRKDSLVVEREGWNDIRLDTAEGFQLQKDDRLAFETEPRSAPQNEMARVTLVSPGLPFSQSATVQNGSGIDASLVLPTLVQHITDAYAPKPDWKEIPREDADLFPWVAAVEKSFNQVPVVLPHPDFSKIRIRRNGEDGKESILEVDLTEAIRGCTDATTPLEARAADVFLKNGDVVELPIVADRMDETWKGFTFEETRFFQRALAGRVLLKSDDGKIEQVEIDYQPPEWRVSSYGILPLPPVKGRASTRLISFSVSDGARIRREGSGSFVAEASMFVRDGDQIDWKRPRPRVFAPPSPQPQR